VADAGGGAPSAFPFGKVTLTPKIRIITPTTAPVLLGVYPMSDDKHHARMPEWPGVQLDKRNLDWQSIAAAGSASFAWLGSKGAAANRKFNSSRPLLARRRFCEKPGRGQISGETQSAYFPRCPPWFYQFHPLSISRELRIEVASN
jgi:hypothetical protein